MRAKIMSKKVKAVAASAAGHRPAVRAVVSSLEELEKLCREPVTIAVDLKGRKLEVVVYGLRPAEALRVEEVLEKALPPLVPGEDGKEDRFDVSSPTYLAEKRKNQVRGRALAVYLGCPLFREARPDLEDLEAITAFVQGQLNDGLVEMIYQAVIKATHGFGRNGEEGAAINFS